MRWRLESPRVSAHRIALLVHPRRDIRAALAGIREWAEEHGAELVQIRVHGDEPQVAPDGTADGVSLIVAVGGDGTVLAALRTAAPSALPVLGVACGSLGALSTVTAADIRAALDRFAAGEWSAYRIPAVHVRAAGREASAINDLVVVRAGGGQVSTAVEIDGVLYGRFSGDGVIVSTQIGSSAYALAAGGPVLAPGSDAWLVTPLAPHGGCIPPVAVGARSRVAVTVDPGFAGARVEIDGRPTDLAAGTFDLALRPDYATLVRLGDEESFLTGLRHRKILMDSPRVLARDARGAD
jgi:NAD+ kinase